MSPRRRTIPLVLFTVFVLVPLLEIYVIVQVGQVIGAWWTIVLLVADSIFGAWLLRHEGGRAWRARRPTGTGAGVAGSSRPAAP